VPDTVRTSDERERWHVQRFAEIDSTNRYLLDEARGGAAAGLVAVADHQTAGRGRFDRRWEAPPGSSLLVSVLLRPAPHGDAAHDASHWAVMAAALALADAVDKVAGVTAELKWPNDLVVGDRKLAGLLGEREGDALVIGAGCNVEWEAFPPELAATSTACNLEAGRSVDRDALLDQFLAGLATELDALEQVPERYRARLATLGRRVRVERAHDTLVGDAVDVTHDGVLVVRCDDGTDKHVTAGDVVHLRS
jgi:BirA family transcriptional regulator, biotin operon repressor / biotin---[acetyl-CoA-carboxylase] ligase